MFEPFSKTRIRQRATNSREPTTRAVQSSRICIVSLALLSLCSATSLPADSLDERFIQGLNDRRLFSLAEAHARQRLAQQVDDDDRVALTIALCRTLAEHALNTPRAERDALWEAANEAAEDFARAAADSPKLVLVRMQQALSVLARGELARQEAEVGAPGVPSLEEARTQLQASTEQLREVGAATEKLLRSASRTPAAGELGQDALVSLARNVQYQTARALRNQALCYPPKSAERADALLQALEQLGPLAKLETGDALVLSSRLDEAGSLRLAGRLTDAAARLDALDAARPPAKVRLQAQAERVRLLLAAGKLEDALGVLQKGREIAGQSSAELDLAHVETFIALWRRASDAKDSAQAKQWQDRAAAMVQAMEQFYGPYWTRRGEMLLAASAGSGTGDASLEVLVRAAKNHYLRMEFDEAVAAYQRAGEAAMAAKNPARAIDLLHAAALVEQRRNRLPAALKRLRELSLLLRDEPKAPAIHLQAVLDAAQIARDGMSESLQSYLATLEEHISTWPADATSDQARLWLGRLREHQRDWAGAIETYREVSAGDQQQSLEALDGAARAYGELFVELAAAKQSIEEPAAKAVNYFEGVVTGGGTRLPDAFSPIARQAALHAARLRLEFTSGGFDVAKNVLAAALRDSADASPEWKAQANALLVVAQAGSGERDAARQTLQQLSGGTPAGQLSLLRGLQEISATSQPAVRRELAALQLEVAQRLRSNASELSAADRLSLDLIEAQSLAARGQQNESLALYRQMSKSHPDHAEIQRGYAELLLESADRDSLLAARDAWRNVLRRARPNSPLWFEAKYSTALAHFKLGDKLQAAQMIELLQSVQPELGGAEMKRKFLELLARCN
jgi:hypothetical protein